MFDRQSLLLSAEQIERIFNQITRLDYIQIK